MLVGEPPFTGPSAAAISLRHVTEEPAQLSRRRPSTPVHVNTAAMHALAKVPTDRFASTSTFLAALASPLVTKESPRPRTEQSRTLVAVGAAVVVVSLIAVLLSDRFGSTAIANLVSPADTARYVVFPFNGDTSSEGRLDIALYDAMSGWDGIEVVDPNIVADAIARVGSPRDLSEAAAMARRLHAGRMVWGQVSGPIHSQVLRVALYDPRNFNVQIANASTAARLTTDADPIDRLATTLLFSGTKPFVGQGHTLGTRSRPAQQLYLQGRDALQDWDLALADSLFDKAQSLDRDYARATLWLAQVRAWRDPRSPSVADLASRAIRK